MGNFDEQKWGDSVSAVTASRRRTYQDRRLAVPCLSTPRDSRRADQQRGPTHRAKGRDRLAQCDQLTELFGRDKSTISRHLRNVIADGELEREGVVADFASTASDGKTYQVAHYKLNVVISVGYRVKSTEGVAFRRWAMNHQARALRAGGFPRVSGSTARLRQGRAACGELARHGGLDAPVEFVQLTESVRRRPDPVALAARDLGDDAGIRQSVDRVVCGGRGCS